MFEDLIKVFDSFQEFQRDQVPSNTAVSQLQLEQYVETKARKLDNEIAYKSLDDIEAELSRVDPEMRHPSTLYLHSLNSSAN